MWLIVVPYKDSLSLSAVLDFCGESTDYRKLYIIKNRNISM